jgi:hypothetical protein
MAAGTRSQALLQIMATKALVSYDDIHVTDPYQPTKPIHKKSLENFKKRLYLSMRRHLWIQRREDSEGSGALTHEEIWNDSALII